MYVYMTANEESDATVKMCLCGDDTFDDNNTLSRFNRAFSVSNMLSMTFVARKISARAPL